MATQLDLQEQEQLDALKAFWKQYGNLVTWTLIVALGAFATWNGWNWWQREQAAKAGALYEELDKAAIVNDADKATRVFADLKERHARTAWAQQGALLAAKVQSAKGQADGARASLQWAIDSGPDADLRTIARLRLAALQLDAGQGGEALKTLDATPKSEGFEPLIEDRRGDVLQAQGQKAEARAAYERAFAAMSPQLDYRRVVEAKLAALGGGAAAAAAQAPASGASK